LWSIDFLQAVDGMNTQLKGDGLVHNLEAFGGDVESHYISAIKMPSMKVKADEVRRDSRPYMMPGFDEPLSEIGVTFVMDSPVDSTTSKVYRFLEMWRAFVRAGRGAMGNERAILRLGKKFRVNFRFPVTISLLRGNAKPIIHNAANLSNMYYGSLESLEAEVEGLSLEQKNARLQQILANGGVFTKSYPVSNDLEQCALFQVEGMWLSGFKISDLDYTKGNEISRIEATFFADSVTDLNQK